MGAVWTLKFDLELLQNAGLAEEMRWLRLTISFTLIDARQGLPLNTKNGTNQKVS